MDDTRGLRPIERRVLRLKAEGQDVVEIGRRFRRSPQHIERIVAMTELPGRTGSRPSPGGLRPIERRVLRWRDEGAGHEEIAKRFRRSPGHIRRVEGLALFKTSVKLLTGQG